MNFLVYEEIPSFENETYSFGHICLSCGYSLSWSWALSTTQAHCRPSVAQVQRHLFRPFPFPLSYLLALLSRSKEKTPLIQWVGHVNTHSNSFISLWLEIVDFPRCLICVSIYMNFVFLKCGQASCKTGKGKTVFVFFFSPFRRTSVKFLLHKILLYLGMQCCIFRNCSQAKIKVFQVLWLKKKKKKESSGTAGTSDIHSICLE